MKKLLLFTSLLLTAASLHASELRVHGANAIWQPLSVRQADLEEATGATIKFNPNAAGRGLADLAKGQCDIAMVTGSLEAAAEGANKEAPGSVGSLSEFVAEKIGEDPVCFIIHPSNTAAKITLAQALDILTGKIKNWKDVGGPDLPIQVLRLGPANGPHIALEKNLLKGQAITSDAKDFKAPKDLVTVLAETPGGFGYVGASNLTEKVKILPTDQRFAMDMFLVTKGQPSDLHKKFIQAAKEIINE